MAMRGAWPLNVPVTRRTTATSASADRVRAASLIAGDRIAIARPGLKFAARNSV